MEIARLTDLFNNSARTTAIKKLLASKRVHTIGIDGLAGSAATVLFAQLPRLARPYLIIANDLDEAGYVYNDLCQLTGEGRALIFPSGYKRDIKYGQVDAPSEILRTEVLNQWHTSKELRWVVTYPEALAERVTSREQVERSTIALSVGQSVDVTSIVKKLRSMGFAEQDYVYEPGQFSLRGSILDVYSFSNELPYRVDFFGDEIDSIRTFNVETQLSEQQVTSIGILHNQNGDADGGTSLLEYVGPDTVLVCHDVEWLKTRVKAIGDEGMSASALIADEGDLGAMRHVVDAAQFVTAVERHRRIDYAMGESASRCDARLTLHCTPQGIYHKNFDLISDSFKGFLARGYIIYILSDSAKQIERLKVIFADRGDDITFEPVLRTLHEGFVDDELKMCVFTDLRRCSAFFLLFLFFLFRRSQMPQKGYGNIVFFKRQVTVIRVAEDSERVQILRPFQKLLLEKWKLIFHVTEGIKNQPGTFFLLFFKPVFADTADADAVLLKKIFSEDPEILIVV